MQCNTQLIATQHNATQPAHDKSPDRYGIDGRAGRSTKNSTEKFGQKTLQVYTLSNPTENFSLGSLIPSSQKKII